jgi:hypothetical protein
MQMAAASLLVKDQDVTRSTVQKAVVVLASQPVFGPMRLVPQFVFQCTFIIFLHICREKLRVVTHALFNQRYDTELSKRIKIHRFTKRTRDFRETNILSDFCKSLEGSLQKQLTESGLYMGMLYKAFM